MISLIQWWNHTVKKNAESLAVVDDNGRSFTFQQLDRESDALAEVLGRERVIGCVVGWGGAALDKSRRRVS